MGVFMFPCVIRDLSHHHFKFADTTFAVSRHA